jgi:hypothetical protein
MIRSPVALARFAIPLSSWGHRSYPAELLGSVKAGCDAEAYTLECESARSTVAEEKSEREITNGCLF